MIGGAAPVRLTNRVDGPAGMTRSFSAPPLLVMVILAVVGYLVLPLLGMLVFGALTDTPPATEPHFTAQTLRAAYWQPSIVSSLINSVIYAALTTTLSLLIGGFVAWTIERTDVGYRRFANLLAVAPIVMPAVLLVSGWVMLLSPRSGVLNQVAIKYFGASGPLFDIFSFPGMVWVAVLQELPLAFLWLWPAFRAMNPDYEEAALVAGGSVLQTLRSVTLPMLRPTLVGAWVIFFIYSLGALSVPLLIGMPAKIFLYSTEIYLAASRMPTDLNIASAYSLLFLATTIVGVYVYHRSIRDQDRFVTVRGKAGAPRLVKLGVWRAWVRAALVTILLLVAGLPIAVIVWNSFMPFPQPPSVESLPLLTTRNFRAALDYGPALRALRNSVVLGLLAGVAATVLGMAIAWILHRVKTWPRLVATIDQIATIPLAMPGMIVGISMVWFYLEAPLGIYGTPWILLIAYVTIHLPFAVRICGSGIAQLHPELEEAAQIAGAGPIRTFAAIVFKLVLPSIAASTLFVGLRSFREYAASLFLTAPGTEVFAVLVLDLSQSGNTNILAAYTSMVIALLALVLIVIGWLARRFNVGWHAVTL